MSRPIALDCPVRLLHGLRDNSVPWQTSLRLAERLTSRNVAVTLVKDGDHRLSTAPDLDRLAGALDEFGRALSREKRASASTIKTRHQSTA